MFATALQALELGIEPNELGLQLWDTVEMLGQSSWFFANLAFDGEATICPKSVLLSGWRKLDELLKAQNEALSVVNVMLVSSPSLNGTEYWRMERLVSLHLALETRRGELCCVYNLGHATYVESTSHADLTGEFMIYRDSKAC